VQSKTQLSVPRNRIHTESEDITFHDDNNIQLQKIISHPIHVS